MRKKVYIDKPVNIEEFLSRFSYATLFTGSIIYDN